MVQFRYDQLEETAGHLQLPSEWMLQRVITLPHHQHRWRQCKVPLASCGMSCSFRWQASVETTPLASYKQVVTERPVSDVIDFSFVYVSEASKGDFFL